MIYAQVENGQILRYPLSEQDIKSLFPNTSFLTDFSPPDGFVRVEIVPAPQVDHTQTVSQSTPIFVDGIWQQTWIMSPATDDEIFQRTQQKEAQVRKQRNELLLACDWTQLADAPVSALDWAVYRQALRDVTKQSNFPWSVEWPTEPGQV